MKKTIKIFMILTLSLLLASCSGIDSQYKDRLASPKNIQPPIQGKWVIQSYRELADSVIEIEERNQIGKEALFHKDAVIVGYDYTTKPSFKLKKLNSSDYFLYKYKIKAEDISIFKEEIEIVTILNDNQYFNEFIIIDDDTLIVNNDNKFYTLKRKTMQVSLEETMRYIDLEKAMIRDPDTTDTEKKETGLILGIKIPVYDSLNQLANWRYKSLWIKSNDFNILEVYQLENLLLPKKNGFLEVSIERDKEGDFVRDFIAIDDSVIRKYTNVGFMASSPILKNIQYLGSSYISIEEIIKMDDDRKVLNIYSLDNLENASPVKLSSFIEESAREIFLEGAQGVISLEETFSANEANIGLKRNKGHWIFNGRINYIQNDRELFKDFNIRAIPPKNLVVYDENIITWEAVKRKIPDAVDMFSSPNNDFILVMTNYNLQIFTIENNDSIGQNPIRKINLPKNASPVMSEWALGRYVDLWEREIISRGGQILDE